VTKPVHSSHFRSGVAARLAGIPVETLRVWERRYQVSESQQTPGEQRLYSKADIERLTLLKRLVDLGHAIGTLARLDISTLQSMQTTLLGLSQEHSDHSHNGAMRLGAIGPLLSAGNVFEQLTDIDFELVLTAPSMDQACAQYKAHHSAQHSSQNSAQQSALEMDLLFIEAPILVDASPSQIIQAGKDLGAKKLVLLYRFAPSTVIRQLRLQGVAVVRAPLDAYEISSLCRSILGAYREGRPGYQGHSGQPSQSKNQDQGGQHSEALNPGGLAFDPPGPPHFNEAALLKLSRLKSSVYCECPSQLAELLINVNGFEQYSRECASKTPEDKKLHQLLELRAAQARNILETALAELIRAEGLAV
jgi:MerR family transcriptional regulator, light-induced transcriptional regulator